MFYRGDKNDDIYVIKQKLSDLGYSLQIDNQYDLDLEIAISDIQQKNNLTIDHIIGPRTRKTIFDLKSIDDPSMTKVLLGDVPYLTQRDNSNVPSGTCNVTSVAMLLAYNKVTTKNGQLEDKLFRMLESQEGQTYFKKNFPTFANQGYNARNIHGMLVWLIRQYNLKDSFTMNLELSSFGDKIKETNQPIITSGLFTRYGHIVLVVGTTTNGDLIVHDPWGDWNTAYKSHNGRFRLYSYEEMKDILKGNSSTKKIGHIIDGTI